MECISLGGILKQNRFNGLNKKNTSSQYTVMDTTDYDEDIILIYSVKEATF
jgi:hypothetical protein